MSSGLPPSAAIALTDASATSTSASPSGAFVSSSFDRSVMRAARRRRRADRSGRRSLPGLLRGAGGQRAEAPIDREVQLEHVHARLAEDAEVAPLRELADEGAHAL